MDRRAGPGGHRGGEDGGFIIEPKEVQEPKEGGLSVTRDEEKSSGGDDGGVGSAPSTDWTRVSHAERTPVVDVEDDEFDG